MPSPTTRPNGRSASPAPAARQPRPHRSQAEQGRAERRADHNGTSNHNGTSSQSGNPRAEAPAQANGPAQGDSQQSSGIPPFFQQVADLMDQKNCELNLLISKKEGGNLRLAVIGSYVQSDDDDEKKKGQPFKPVTITATPEELDNPQTGLGAFIEHVNGQSKTLAQVRAEADKAHEQAVKAEKRRKEKAKQKRNENAKNGPLFADDDDDDGEDD